MAIIFHQVPGSFNCATSSVHIWHLKISPYSFHIGQYTIKSCNVPNFFINCFIKEEKKPRKKIQTAWLFNGDHIHIIIIIDKENSNIQHESS